MGLIPGNAIAGLKWRSPVYFDVQRSPLYTHAFALGFHFGPGQNRPGALVPVRPFLRAVVSLDEDRFNNSRSFRRNQDKLSNGKSEIIFPAIAENCANPQKHKVYNVSACL